MDQARCPRLAGTGTRVRSADERAGADANERSSCDHPEPPEATHNLSWRSEIQQMAGEVENGTLRAITPPDIEPSAELGHTPNIYLEYDGVYDRLTYRSLGWNPLEHQLTLLAALTARTHLRFLAQIAGVSPQVLALTYRVCENLQSEYVTVGYLVQLENMAAWLRADPSFQHHQLLARTDVITRLNPAQYLVNDVFGSRSLTALTSSRLPEAEREGLVMLDDLNRLRFLYPSHTSALCSRYVISRGPRRGLYLVPSDVAPITLHYLERVPVLTDEPSDPSTLLPHRP